MVAATLTEIGEFLSELDRDVPHLDRPLVRVSKVGRPVEGAALTAVSVEAGYVAHGEIVRLRIYCGYLWGLDEQDLETQDKATSTMREIEDGIATRGLQVRAGLYDEIVGPK